MKHRLNRLISALLALVMVLAPCPTSVRAEATTAAAPVTETESGAEPSEVTAEPEADLTIVASGTCGENVTWTLDSNGPLVVKGTGAVYSYMSGVATPWYNFSDDEITTLVVEEGITSIGSHAFASCKVSQLSLPDSLQTIGAFAFCPKNLTELTIPAGVTTIGSVAFGDSTTLKTIRFLGDAPEMGLQCFRDANAVCYYPFGNATWTVAAMQQYGGQLTWVSYGTESGCPQSRYGHAYDCVLTPATEDSPAYFIHTCTNCWDTYVEPYNSAAEGMCGEALSWSLEDGNLYLAGMGSMEDYASPAFDLLNAAPWYSYREPIKGIAFNGPIDSIGSYALYDAYNLTSVVIPDRITSIGEGAFSDCSLLEVITFAGDAPSIGIDAFKNVTATCYYPAGNDTWTADVRQQYGGSLTWIASTDEPQTPTVASGQCGDNVTWTLNNEGLLKIEGTGDMWDYSAQGSNSPGWSSYQTPVKTVIIMEGVTSIGDNTFYNCMSLTSITIPEGVTSIGASAFYDCDSLSGITIPESVTSIDASAFYSCSSLTGITIPEGVTSIQYQTFLCCSSLTSVSIPESVTSIDPSAFYGCSGLTSISLPEGITSIGKSAFSCCTSLTSISLPEGITSIGSYAFNGCSSLTEITFTGDAPRFGTDTFYRVTATCYYPVTNSTWTSDVMQNYGGTLTWKAFNPETGKVYVASGQCGDNLTWTLDSVGELIIEGTGDMWNTGSEKLWPDYLTSIKTVVIGEGVTTIGDYAFYCCSSLTSVSIPEGVTSIGDSGFRGCTSLTDLSIPKGVTIIGMHAFAGCTSLTEAHIPEGVTAIQDYTFDSCSALADVTIPDGVTFICDRAFAYCTSLTSVSIPEGVTYIGEYAFVDCSSLTSVSIPEGVTCIGAYAFDHCSSLTSVSIPEGVTYIGNYAFEDCTSLTEVAIPKGTTTIREGLFRGCTRLAKVSLPDSLTSIGASAFFDCNSLTELTIPEGVTSIGTHAFCYCKSLTSITIPEGVTSIGDTLFWGCTRLAKVSPPDSLTSIGNFAFCNCNSLTSVTIPEGVTSIGNSAFSNCSSLTNVYFTGDAPTIGTNAFGSVTATCYYPVRNATWTSDVMQNYSGTLTWVPGSHFDIDFASMTMGNSLAINFAFDKGVMDDWTGCYAEIVKTYADDREDMVVTVPFSQWKSATINGTAHYYVTFDGVAAKEMTDEIRVTIRNADGIAVSNTKTDSVRDQSIRALAKEGVTDEEKTMIVDMLNYGAAAQEYFGYGAEDLANAQLSEEQKAYASESIPCANNRTSSGSFVASTVVLKSNIQIMFAFSNVDESHYAVVTFTNHRGVTKEITVPGSEFTSNGSAKVVTVDALVAADGRQEVTCVVYDANGNEVARVTDSLASYTARNNGENAMFILMMCYSDSAYNFFH